MSSLRPSRATQLPREPDSSYDRVLAKLKSASSRLPPPQTIILRSLALSSIVIIAFASVCICWNAMYKAIVPKEGRTENVWLQYG